MPRSFLNAEQPLNIAHRGASAAAPPNTLTAFEKAWKLGAEAVELDVRLCADGVPVVMHDATVDRTTDGSGRVTEMTLAELKKLDAGSWFDAAFAGERIPTLAEALAAVGERLLVNVELKSSGVWDAELEKAVVGVIEQCSLGARVLLSSFNPFALRRIQRMAPHLRTALLCSRATQLSMGIARLISPRPYAAVHPHHATVDEGTVSWARQRDARIHVWTVDDAAEMRRLIACGVDGIITNVPDVLHGVLRQGGGGV